MTDDPRPARERCEQLIAAGEALRRLPISEIAGLVGTACRRWCDPSSSFRSEAEDALARHYGVPSRMIAPVLDAAFSSWTTDRLIEWVALELGSERVLDEFTPLGSVRRRALGPGLIAAISSHGIPTTPVSDIVAALLVKSPIWLKPATGSDDLAERFSISLKAIDPRLGDAVETSRWGPDSPASKVVLGSAEFVIATGGDETIRALRRVVDDETRLVVHGPRLSIAVVMREALRENREGVIEALAHDTAFGGQMGCLSPVTAYIEASIHQVNDLAEPLHEACVRNWAAPPRREASPAVRAAWGEWLALAGVETAAGTAGRIAGGADDGWSVQVRARPEPPGSPIVPRLLRLAPMEDVGGVVACVTATQAPLATVGVAGPEDRIGELASMMAAAGVERITPLGGMQHPGPEWRRDGRPILGDLVRWTDWEP